MRAAVLRERNGISKVEDVDIAPPGADQVKVQVKAAGAGTFAEQMVMPQNGGVGINVIQGARICGASAIVAVDTVESKPEMAKRFGATHGATPENLQGVSAEVTGGASVSVDFHRLIGLWRGGRLDLEALIPRRLTLDQVDDGFDAMERGDVIRQVITP